MEAQEPSRVRVVSHEAIGESQVKIMLEMTVVTHARPLVAALDRESSCRSILLEKQLSETIASEGAAAGWAWPSR